MLGPSGVGKTAVLDVVLALRRLLSGDARLTDADVFPTRTRGQGYTLLIDEPENYVALREIQPWLMSLEDACGDTLSQTVIASHHPELIDYLGRENGILLQRETSGVITARRLDTRSETDGGVELSELVERQGAAPPRFQGARRSTGA